MRKLVYILIHPDGTLEPGVFRKKIAQRKQTELAKAGVRTSLKAMRS